MHKIPRSVPSFLLAALLLVSLLTSTAIAGASGLPIPRFVSLRSAEINLRRGPGTQYLIDWIFVRAGLPVEVISEFETWRKVRDIEGAEGWVHQSMLSGKRTIMTPPGQKPVLLRANPKLNSKPVARIQGGTVGYLKKCQDQWCRVTFQAYSGWLLKGDFWGLYKDEVLK